MKITCALCLAAATLLIEPAQGAEQMKPLFNGRDFDGWVNVNCAENTWTVRDGLIICTGVPTGVLRTTRHFENFILELEWKHLHPRGNAGLFVYSDAITAPGQPFTKSIECQIMEGNHGDVFAIHGATMVPDRPHPRGWMRSLPSESRANPAGEWNHYRVESRDGCLSLAVNGKVVSGGSECAPRKGYICLESEGSEVHFRNIRIQELPSSNPAGEHVAAVDEGFRSLYNGLDLSNWRTAAGDAESWRPKDWILENDGGLDGAVLWSKEEFADFVLIVDWRLPKGQGAAGSFSLPIRLRGGAEIRVRAQAAPGKWHRFEITVQGERVAVARNGEPVPADLARTGTPPRGPIGLRGAGQPSQFANVYIKPLPSK